MTKVAYDFCRKIEKIDFSEGLEKAGDIIVMLAPDCVLFTKARLSCYEYVILQNPSAEVYTVSVIEETRHCLFDKERI